MWGGPWIVLVDFNYLTDVNECTGHVVQLQENFPLRNCMHSCGLHDLNFSGCFLTWSIKRSGEAHVFSKIDRLLGNHTPLLIQFIKQPRGKKNFKFFNHWVEQDGFLECVSDAWSSSI